GEPTFQGKLKQAICQLLESQFRSFVITEDVHKNGNAASVGRLFFLIGLTGSREALPILLKFLPFVESQDGVLLTRLIGCIASLAKPEDTGLVPWLLEKAKSSDKSRIALRALYRIHPLTAAAALPSVARALSET